MQKCPGGLGVGRGGGKRETGLKIGGTWGRALQLSAILNVGYVLGTSLRKEAANTTLECCFSLNVNAVNVDFVRDFVVTQGKTHSQVSLLLQEAYPGKRGLSSRSVRRFWNTRAKSAVKRRAGTLRIHETSCCSGGYFCLKFLFFFLWGKNG